MGQSWTSLVRSASLFRWPKPVVSSRRDTVWEYPAPRLEKPSPGWRTNWGFVSSIARRAASPSRRKAAIFWTPAGASSRNMRKRRRNCRGHKPQWGVEDYARQLGVSRERLGFAVRKATGLSPQAYIHRELLSEARDLLLNSSLQVAEIAFRLGFQDPGYFNRFFTRNEGTSPGRFRRMGMRMQNVPPPSYAAWP